MRATFAIPEPVCPDPPGRDCYPGATIKPGWTMPVRDGYRLIVVDTGEWAPYWCADGTEPYDTTDDDLAIGEAFWPFVEDVARACDWEALGIEVI